MESKQQKQFVKFVEQQCSRLVETNNLARLFKAFKRNYILVPLEVFGKNPYKTLVSTILSARTKDEVTFEASKRLFAIASNLKILSEIDIKLIEKTIYPVGFYKTKAKHLKQLAINLTGSEPVIVPRTREELMKLPGVG